MFHFLLSLGEEDGEDDGEQGDTVREGIILLFHVNIVTLT